jgi:hypothetical protein
VGVSPEGDIEQLLKMNLERAGIRDAMQDLFERFKNDPDFANNPLLKGWQDKFSKIDFNDPKNKKNIQKVLDKLQKNDDFINKLKKKGLTKDKLKQIIDQNKKDIDDDDAKKSKKGNDVADPDHKGNPDDNNPKNIHQQQRPPHNVTPQIAEDWLERVKKWKVVGEMLNDSEALQGMVNDLTTSYFNNEGGENSLDTLGLADKVGNWADAASGGASFLEKGLSGLKGIQLPSLHLPNLSLGNLPTPSFGAGGGGGGEGAGGLARVLVLGAVAVLLGLIVWQVLSRLGIGPGAAAAGSGWRLGPWPVNPAFIGTREELIMAFEFLSLLLLGPAARTWNHRDIATGMGATATGATPEKQSAADRLADLYEAARYAPEREPLTGEALAEARRNLCFLAGVASA